MTTRTTTRQQLRRRVPLARLLWLPALAGLLAAPAFAQGIEARVDRTEVTIEDSIRWMITVSDAQGTEPRLPALPDFNIVSRGQSSQIRIVNGRTSASIRYEYLLSPKRTGSFTLPPATIEVGGRTLSSRPISVKVLPASAQPKESKDVFLSATVSTPTPWVGQQVIYTWRLYSRVQLANAQLEPREFDGFLVEDLGEIQQYQTTINGQAYVVNELRKALFPQEAGKLTIPGSLLHCQVIARPDGRRRSLFDEVFGRGAAEARTLRTRPIELEVRPLPPAPPDFSGLVGKFDLAARLTKDELKVGESTTLKLTVSGTGNAQMIPAPKAPPLPDFKVYEENPTSSIDRSGSSFSGSKSYSKALVPLQPGEREVPSFTLTWFDAERGLYRTSRTPKIPLHVAPADGREDLRLTESLAPTTGKVAVRILADDILPLYKDLDAVTSSAAGPVPAGVLAGGLAVPPLLFFGVWVGHRRRERYAADSGLRRRRTALASARKALVALGTADGSAAAAETASRLLRRFIGDKLGCEGNALTPEEAGTRLFRAGIEEEAASRVRRLLERLEAAQYLEASQPGAAGLTAADLRQEVEALLADLDRRLA